MVFVVRRDLQWSKQKLAVMTAHAALALFKKLYKGRHPALTQWVRTQFVVAAIQAEKHAAEHQPHVFGAVCLPTHSKRALFSNLLCLSGTSQQTCLQPSM